MRLARKGRYRTSPNPMVGAVVVRDGRVVGRGFHRQVGGPHAEVEALADAGERARGAAIYVNLEPCCAWGRTPPCVDALLAAGVAKVSASHVDPDPRVAGEGFARLRRGGVEVEVGAARQEALRLNLNYLIPLVHGRPAVTLKWAMSLDGRIATAAGESKWISSPAGRRWGLALREEHDGIVVGSGTVLADDPRLGRRLGLAAAANVRSILDRRLRTPANGRLFRVAGPVLIYTESSDSARRRALEERGAAVVRLARVDPVTVLADLYERGLRSVLVEGGGTLLAAFVAAGCFDRVAVDCAPRLIGGERAPGPLGGPGASSLAAAPRLTDLWIGRRGGDLVLDGLREGCLQELSESVDG